MSGLFSMEAAQLKIKQKHNELLVDLCDLMCIDCQSYKNFIGYLRNAHLPAGRLQRVLAEPMEVFHLMEERGILKEGDYSALEEALDASGHKQALELVKKVGSKITKLMEAMQESSAAADGSHSNKKKSGIQESSTDADGSLSNKKKSAILESSTAAYGSASNKKSSDDKDFHVEETDPTAASKDITPSPQPASLVQSKSQSVHVAAVIPQLPLIDPSSAQFISSGQQPSVGRSDLVPFGASQGQGRDTAVLQDEMEFFEAIRNNTQKIEQMIRSKKIPKRSAIETVVKQDGYSKNIQMALREMSNLLREIPESVGVWCGYMPNDPFNPVFVVTLKNQNCILKKTEVLELFIDYSIIIQYKYIPNDEERNIEKQYGSKTIRSEDVARLNNCIAAHTESLMNEHSNLSIIRACPVKSRGYLRNQMDVIEKPCIVLYVPVKGIIPVGEKEFPTEIDGIVTDVREGEFYLFGGHKAMEYHQKLRMGCCISDTGDTFGTLGGFVDLPDGKIGCLTAAHVVLDENDIQQYISLQEEDKRNINNELACGTRQIRMYQPIQTPGLEHFGRVHTIAMCEESNHSPSVDAAIIEITDDKRKPEMGNFPDGDFEEAGFTTADPMFYASGGIMDAIPSSQRGSLVIKYGCTTGITRGCMEWIGESVRLVNPWSNYSFPVIWQQLEVKSKNFAAPGDSGALVFLCIGGNIRHLLAVGMVIGGSSTGCQCFITPIKAVFEKLGLKDNRFKVFPRRKLSQQQPAAQPLIEQTNTTELLTTVEQNINEYMNERFATVEQSINQRFLMAEQNITENINELFIRIEQNMNENVNGRFNRLEDLLNRFIH